MHKFRVCRCIDEIHGLGARGDGTNQTLAEFTPYGTYYFRIQTAGRLQHQSIGLVLLRQKNSTGFNAQIAGQAFGDQ